MNLATGPDPRPALCAAEPARGRVQLHYVKTYYVETHYVKKCWPSCSLIPITTSSATAGSRISLSFWQCHAFFSPPALYMKKLSGMGKINNKKELYATCCSTSLELNWAPAAVQNWQPRINIMQMRSWCQPSTLFVKIDFGVRQILRLLTKRFRCW